MDRKPLKHEALIMDKLYIDKGSSCGRVFHKLLAMFVAGVYCSAWSRSQVQNQSFGPKQNTKLTVDPQPPTHQPPYRKLFAGF